MPLGFSPHRTCLEELDFFYAEVGGIVFEMMRIDS